MPEDRTSRSSSVYRIYDATSTLIYVGVTSRGHRRNVEHAEGKSWAREIHHTEWEHFDTRADALAREKELIKTKHPKHNKVHAVDGGEAERVDFILRADQRDLLSQLDNEIRRARKEFRQTAASFESQLKLLHGAVTHFLSATKTGRPLNDEEMKTMGRVLDHLERVDAHNQAVRDAVANARPIRSTVSPLSKRRDAA